VSARLLRLFALVLGLAASAGAGAMTSCAPADTPGMERCVSGLSPAMLQQMYQPQEESNWCWAASIAMLLRHYGLAMRQEEVVRTGLGSAANERVSDRQLQDLLDRQWQDRAGRQAASTPMPLPAWRRTQGLAAPEVLDDLRGDRPLLVATGDHAMVLVQVVYERRIDGRPVTPAGVKLLRVVVLDPGSGSWLRSLGSDERLEFVARVRVTPGDSGVQQLAARTEETPTLR
jgi:hypothetical protein